MRYPRPVDRRLPSLLALCQLALCQLALCLVAGCEGAGVPDDVDVSYAVVRLAVDPITGIGQLFRDQPAVANGYETGFDRLSCDGEVSLAFHFEGRTPFVDARGLGDLSFLAVTPKDTSDLCGGSGEAEVQPLSYVSPLDRVPLVQGPAWMEGATIDARIPLGRFPGLELFPEWWSASARGRELPPAPDGKRRFVLTEGEASTVWSPAQLFGVPVPVEAGFPEGSTPLDVLAAGDLQPDVDVDNDGFETYVDTDFDGLVDRCVEGDGSILDGRDCAFAPGFEDGYELRLRFRLVRLASLAE